LEFPEYDSKVKYHEAGYDSYCTGYVFLKMAYYFARDDLLFSQAPLTKILMMPEVNQWKNKIRSSGSLFSGFDLEKLGFFFKKKYTRTKINQSISK